MIHLRVQAVVIALGKSKEGFEMQMLDCVHCGRTPPMQANRCNPCNNSNLSQKYCTAGFRLAEYFTILQKVELWPTVEPFESCSVADLVFRISRAIKDIKHSCDARNRCPLIQELQHLGDRAIQIQEQSHPFCLDCIRQDKWGNNYTCTCATNDETP